MFDTDGNGFIEKDELKELMGNLEMEHEDWLVLIEDYDTDGDGRVSHLLNLRNSDYFQLSNSILDQFEGILRIA